MNRLTELINIGLKNKIDITKFYKGKIFQWHKYEEFLRVKKLIK